MKLCHVLVTNSDPDPTLCPPARVRKVMERMGEGSAPSPLPVRYHSAPSPFLTSQVICCCPSHLVSGSCFHGNT